MRAGRSTKAAMTVPLPSAANGASTTKHSRRAAASAATSAARSTEVSDGDDFSDASSYDGFNFAEPVGRGGIQLVWVTDLDGGRWVTANDGHAVLAVLWKQPVADKFYTCYENMDDDMPFLPHEVAPPPNSEGKESLPTVYGGSVLTKVTKEDKRPERSKLGHSFCVKPPSDGSGVGKCCALDPSPTHGSLPANALLLRRSTCTSPHRRRVHEGWRRRRRRRAVPG